MKDYFKKNYLLILLLLITLLKGAIWSFSVPLFQAPDEQFHYATIQYYAIPEGQQPQSYNSFYEKNSLFDVNTQNISPELKNFLEKTDFERIRFKPDNQNFFGEFSGDGINENQIRGAGLSRHITELPAWFTRYGTIYYKPMAVVENLAGHLNIIERFFLIRLFSVLLGTLLVFTAYFVFRELFFDKTKAVIFAGIISFHPMLTFINSSVNIDPLLFLSFGVFILGCVRILRGKIDWKTWTLVLSGLIVGIGAKPPGWFTLPALLLTAGLYFFVHRDKFTRLWKIKSVKISACILALSAFSAAALLGLKYFSVARKIVLMAPSYAEFQMKYGHTFERSVSYWGKFGWLDTPLSKFYLYFLWALVAVAAFGVVKYFVSVFRKKNRTPDENIALSGNLLFVFFAVGVSLMIHLVNMYGADPNDLKNQAASIGTQGRYFFPAIIPQFALIALGLKNIFQKIPEKYIFIFLLVLMVFLNFVSLFNYVIPRYYF